MHIARWLMTKIAVCVAGSIAVFASPSFAEAPSSFGRPAGASCEGESYGAGGSTIILDDKASGGKAIQAAREWQPILSAPVPPGSGDLSVWVRYRGGAFQIKTNTAGKQTERDWVWGGADAWTWVRVGRYSRDALGESILLMHGGGNNEVSIDMVVFSSDPAAHPKGMDADGHPELPPESPDAAAPAKQASVTIDWERATGKITPLLWGVNDYEICDPQAAVDEQYNVILSEIHPGLIRIHWANLMNAWTDPKTRDWDMPKIKAGFDKLSKGYGNAQIMLNIPWWPDWLKPTAGEPLEAEKEAEFISLVARLVTIMRKDVGRPVAYWELLNEREQTYEKAGQLDRQWDLQNRIFAAIKRNDPQAKVGGPAFTWPKPQWVESFLKACGNNVDFITWHNYASGDPFTSNEKLFQLPDTLEANAKFVIDAAKRIVPGKHLEYFLTEYNVQWNWEPFERRHANNVGAAFDACVLSRMADLGLTGVTIWHAKGDAYGVIAGDNKLRAPGELYRLGRKFIVGTRVQTSTSAAGELEVIAVKQVGNSGARSVLLVNKSDHTIMLDGTFRKMLGVDSGEPQGYRIAHDVSMESSEKLDPNSALELPGLSVFLVTIPSR